MQFSMNRDKVEKTMGGDFKPLPQGLYEVVIKSAQEHTTPNGAEALRLELVVRNDLDGVPTLKNTNAKYHNRHVFMDNWKRKDTNDYSVQGIQQICFAAGMPSNYEVNSIQDVINFLNGKPVKAFIKKTTDEYKGKKREINQVAPFNLGPTDYPQVNHKWDSNGQQNNSPMPDHFEDEGTNNVFGDGGNNDNPVVDDSDLPF